VIARRLAQPATRGAQRAQERRRTRLRFITAGGEEDRTCFAGGQAEIVDSAAGRQPIRRRIESQRRAPQLAVETMIVQQRLVSSAQLRVRGTAAFTPRSAYLKQIGEVIGEHDRQAHVDRLIGVIAYPDSLIGGVAPKENRTQDMHPVLFHDDMLIGNDVRIGQIDDERGIVIAQIGAEQQRRDVVHQKFEAREKSCVTAEQSVGRIRRRSDIAVAVEDDEGVVMLERQPRTRRGLRG